MEISQFIEDVNRRRLQALAAIARVPISVLIWGPDPATDTPVANTRKVLKQELLTDNVFASFSEDLYDPASPYSNFTQQVAQAEAFDLIISIPDSFGSVAEIHDFSKLPGISNKVITFLDKQWNNGYSNSTLIQMQSVVSCRVQQYNAPDLPYCIIKAAKDQVKLLREAYYALGRR